MQNIEIQTEADETLLREQKVDFILDETLIPMLFGEVTVIKTCKITIFTNLTPKCYTIFSYHNVKIGSSVVECLTRDR